MSDIRLPSFNDFSPVILKGDLRPCLQAIVDGGGDDEKVIRQWADSYFLGKENKRSSTNIPATLASTGLIVKGRPFVLTAVGNEVLGAPSAQEAAKVFCAYLLKEKNAKLLVQALFALRKRKESITKSVLKKELQTLGVSHLAHNTTDHSTLKNWFIYAGLVSPEGDPEDAEIKSILGISVTELDDFKSLSLGQQVFLKSLRRLHETGPGPFLVKDIFKACMEENPHLFDDAQFARKIRLPLENKGWLEATGLASGAHGGRSGSVFATKKLLDIPIGEVIPDFGQIIPPELRSRLQIPLNELSVDLFGDDKYKAGLALELLALRMIIDLGLDPRSFRLRSSETAYAEVDLIAEGTNLLFSRWTFQCKRYGRETKTKLSLSDVAKEVGIAIFAKAHVIVMVTTTDFSKDAKLYADEVSKATHLQFVFVNGRVVADYLREGKNALWRHFKKNALDILAIKREQPLPKGE